MGEGTLTDGILGDLVKGMGAWDETRIKAAEALVEAANKAFGKEVFTHAKFSRDSQSLMFSLYAKIPCDNPSNLDWSR